MPALGFLPASDPRVQGTIKAIEKNLMQDGFVLRYKPEHTNDGLTGTEGAFLACSFWLVDAYAYSGRTKEAEALFERLIGLRNDLGLLSEEYEPTSGRLIGNFPQAFSHLALVHSASVLGNAELTPRASTNGTKAQPQRRARAPLTRPPSRHWMRFTPGGLQLPSRIEGFVSLGQYMRIIRTNLPGGVGSQLASFSPPGFVPLHDRGRPSRPGSS